MSITEPSAKSEAFDPKVYWEDRLTQVSGLHGVGYLGLGQQFNRWLYRIRAHVLRRLLHSLKIDLRDMAVLDIGSGTGFYIEQWETLGAKSVTGCDLTEIAVNNLRQRFPGHNFYCLDIGSDLPALDESYDLISIFDVLYHIVDDAKYARAILNMWELLNPGGWLFCADYFLHAPYPQRATHMVNRPLAQIEGLLHDAGFETVKRIPMFVLMNKPYDTSGKLLPAWWNMISQLAARGERWGWSIGAALYPFELLLNAALRESPTTEILVCRKRDRQ
jgi:SAM-dependent methyltransferase